MTTDARKRYGSLVWALGLASIALAGCGEYGWLFAHAGKHGSGKPDPDPGSGGGAPVCVDLAFDHDVACNEEIVRAKDQAGAECQKRGLALATFAPGTCLAGEVVRLKYSCCPKPEAPPPPPPPPEADAGVPACVDLALDHDVACEGAPEAKEEAGAECRKRGLELTALDPWQCHAGDVYRLKYTCCPQPEAPPPPPPPPPPEADGGVPACVDLALDHDVACIDATDAKDEAWAECRKRGLQLTDLQPGMCAAGDVFRLKFTCCP